jgi:hypothetical protein
MFGETGEVLPAKATPQKHVGNLALGSFFRKLALEYQPSSSEIELKTQNRINHIA